jgi:hypothetical protein
MIPITISADLPIISNSSSLIADVINQIPTFFSILSLLFTKKMGTKIKKLIDDPYLFIYMYIAILLFLSIIIGVITASVLIGLLIFIGLSLMSYFILIFISKGRC